MPKYKRFLIFACESYYPAGGLSDIEAQADTLEEAETKLKEVGVHDWIEIFDRIEGIVYAVDYSLSDGIFKVIKTI